MKDAAGMGLSALLPNEQFFNVQRQVRHSVTIIVIYE